jgi:phospholipid/cholesterol/gamma-HCH transport system permease protein
MTAMTPPTLTAGAMEGAAALYAAGPWTAAHSARLEHLVAAMGPSAGRVATIDLGGVQQLDTLGAWLLERLVRSHGSHGDRPVLVGAPAHFQGLIGKVYDVNREAAAHASARNRLLAALESVGRTTADLRVDLRVFLEMLGAVGVSLLTVLIKPRRFRLTSAVHHLYRVGWQAVPIMVLITFLIGGIIAQQGIFHFRKFGADAYVVDMVGILILREIGVLIVSIMVAGRSGSAYTAELGSMKMREEIDALRTMGLNPVEVLILPRILALVCALPILTFLGSMAALYGGGLVAWLYGGMSPDIYIARLQEAISVTHFRVGMIKAPFMALVIGIVACSEGLRVKGSAESLGLQTTTSVVKSIFLVIVLDGLFAVFFASIGM